MSTLIVKNLDAPSGQSIAAPDLQMPSGSVIQVVSSTKTDTMGTSTNAYTDTGLSVTITPSSSSSKLYITGDLSIGGQNTYGSIVITDGSNNILLVSDTAGSRPNSSFLTMNNDYYHSLSNGFSYLHSPNTTSAFTVKIRIRAHGNGSYPIYVNRTGEDADGVTGGRGTSVLTVMEIAG
jgi:hypothetical protein